MRINRIIFIYFRLMSQQIKALIEYQTDFLITILSSLLAQSLGLVFLWVIYRRIPEINGWNLWEVAMMYSLIFFTEGFSTLFFNGMLQIGSLVNRGGLDRYLVRPIPPVVQILASEVGIGGIGNLFIGSLIIVNSFRHVQIHWSFQNVYIFLLLIISGIAIRTAILFTACCLVFWSGSGNSSFPYLIHTISDFAKYPISIYNAVVQILIIIIVPYSFISFFPVTFLVGREGSAVYALLSPLVAIYTVLIALFVFKKGLKRYEGSGN